jgi:tetratricopeptide (TPR) repeat protein
VDSPCSRRVARGYRRKRFYSTPMRILAHLSSTPAHEPGTLNVLTQEGIAAATHSGRTTATKWLTRMEAAGLVAGERAHVPGHRVRKTVYHLSHEGWVQAMKLRTRLQGDIVEVLAPGLDPTPMHVAEIPDIFPGYVNMTAAVSLVRRGRLDFTKLHGIGSGAVAPILWGDTLRRLGRVFGRTDEFRILDTWAGSSSSVLVVSGIAGIGKSTLVGSWLVRQRPRPYIYWSEIHEGTTRALFLRDLGAFLARLGRRGLRSVLAENRMDERTLARRILSLEIKDLSILFVFDNVQHANAELARFLFGPLLEIAATGSAKIVFVSRAIPSSLSRKRPENRPRVQILRVDGLDMAASKSLLLSKGFAGDEVAVARAVQAAKGHPILLSFAAQTGSAVGGEMTRYLDREIWHTLTKTERTLLEAASLFRGLVPLDALHRFSSDWQSAIHALQSKNLIAPTIGSGVVMHDAIREYVRKRVVDSRRRAYHALAAAYFLDGSGMRDQLEGLFHLVESGDGTAVGDVLVSLGATLLDSVPATDLQEVLRRIDHEAIGSRGASVLPELRGDALRAIGDLQPALQEYRIALSLVEEHGQSERSPTLLRKIASVERCRAEYAKALGHLVEAQAGLKDRPNPAEGGEILREWALLEKAQGRLAEAAAHMNQAVDLATETSGGGPLARSLTALGSIEGDRGNLERALEYKLEGLRIAERAGNLTETARACISVGSACHALKRYAESLQHYDRALQIARLVGNLRLIAYATMNRCASLMDMGRYPESAADLEEAKQLFQVLEEPDTLFLLDIYEGQREFGLGRWSRAVRLWDHGLNGLRTLGDRSDLARALLYVGRFHAQRGEKTAARGYLAESRDLAKAMGNSLLLTELGQLLVEVGLRDQGAPASRDDV